MTPKADPGGCFTAGPQGDSTYRSTTKQEQIVHAQWCLLPSACYVWGAGFLRTGPAFSRLTRVSAECVDVR